MTAVQQNTNAFPCQPLPTLNCDDQWIRQWLFYANSVRYGSAMSGPDYATFKNGWFEMSSNLKQMENMIKLTK